MKTQPVKFSMNQRVTSSIKMSVHAIFLVLVSFQTCFAEGIQKSASKIKLAEGKASTPGAMEFVLSLVLVLFAIVAMAWLLKRFGSFSGASTSAVKALGGISLGGREKAILVQVGEQQILLGVAPGRVQTLHVLEKPVEVAGGTRTGRDHSFSDKLKGLLNKEKQG